MKSYRYTRKLDGVDEGASRLLSIDEATPLLKSGAVVEDGETAPAPVAPPPAPEPTPDPVIVPQPAEQPAPKPSVTAEPKRATTKAGKPSAN